MDYVNMISTALFCGGLAISAFLLTALNAREFARMKTKLTRIPRIAGSAASQSRRTQSMR
jgi:hypothetical protein